MIRITQLKLPVDHRQEQLRKKIARTLKCGEDTFSYEIVRQSLDARHKDDKKFVYTVDVSTPAEKKMLRKNRDKNVTFFEKKEYCFPKPGEEVLKNPPVIVRWYWNADRRHRSVRKRLIVSGKMGFLIRSPMYSLEKAAQERFLMES